MKAAKIAIQIGADVSKLRKDMKKADGIVGKFTTAAKYGLAGATAAAGAFAFKLGVDGVKAAVADQASQVQLATALHNTTKATDAQIASVEDYISKTQLRYGVEDVLLRQSLNKLATVTGSVTEAQEMQAVALDVAAGSGLSLQQATLLITKALQGSFTGFKKLGVVLSDNITKNKDGAAAVEVLGKKYEGAAAKAADTTEGKLKRLEQAWGEVVEGIGQALIPELEKAAAWALSPSGGKQLEDGIHALTSAVQLLVGALAEAEKLFGRLADAKNELTPSAENFMSWFNNEPVMYDPRHPGLGLLRAKVNSPSSASGFDTTRPGTVINVYGAVDPAATGRIIKKTLNQTSLNAVSPNAGDRRR